jgi:hypothetical protein
MYFFRYSPSSRGLGQRASGSVTYGLSVVPPVLFILSGPPDHCLSTCMLTLPHFNIMFVIHSATTDAP